MVVETWNRENLFRPGTESGPGNQGAYAAKLKTLAGVINRLAPDVLAVQEVGQPGALDDLAEALDGQWRTEVSELPDGRGIRVGFLSESAMQKVEQIQAFPDGLAPIQLDDSRKRVTSRPGTSQNGGWHPYRLRAGRVIIQRMPAPPVMNSDDRDEFDVDVRTVARDPAMRSRCGPR